MTPQSLDANHPLENVFGSIHRPGCLSSVSQGASRDQWLLHAWVTERKPNSWVISRFTFTPRFPLSSRCHAMKSACDLANLTVSLTVQRGSNRWLICQHKVKTQVENSDLFLTLILTLNKRMPAVPISTAQAQRGLTWHCSSFAWQLSFPEKKRCGVKVWNWTMSLPRRDRCTSHWPGAWHFRGFIKTDKTGIRTSFWEVKVSGP